MLRFIHCQITPVSGNVCKRILSAERVPLSRLHPYRGRQVTDHAAQTWFETQLWWAKCTLLPQQESLLPHCFLYLIARWQSNHTVFTRMDRHIGQIFGNITSFAWLEQVQMPEASSKLKFGNTFLKFQLTTEEKKPFLFSELLYPQCWNMITICQYRNKLLILYPFIHPFITLPYAVTHGRLLGNGDIWKQSHALMEHLSVSRWQKF